MDKGMSARPAASTLQRSVSSSAAPPSDTGSGVDILGANWGLRLDFASSSLPQRPSRIRRSQTAGPGLEHVAVSDLEPPPPVVASAMMHALREDEDVVVAAATTATGPVAKPSSSHMLRRSITFSGGDYSPDSPLLVSPPLSDLSVDHDQLRRATSDAAAVAAAWGESTAGSQAQAQVQQTHHARLPGEFSLTAAASTAHDFRRVCFAHFRRWLAAGRHGLSAVAVVASPVAAAAAYARPPARRHGRRHGHGRPHSSV